MFYDKSRKLCMLNAPLLKIITPNFRDGISVLLRTQYVPQNPGCWLGQHPQRDLSSRHTTSTRPVRRHLAILCMAAACTWQRSLKA
ncbi:hypothetical protein U0070_006142 [Myodes glareolus]|uniref:Uncharacterized protein n=1 Tax=Myodes glareolus TaxID=447135 RepID=A0AAW0I4W1_MYOGA